MKPILVSRRQGSVIVLALAIFILVLPTSTAGQLQDLPGTVTPNIKTIPSGSLVIPMDNIRQGNAAGTVFNIRAYGLAVALLRNRIPLQWVIRTGKSKDQVDFSASAVKIAGTGGGTTNGTQDFSGGPLVVYPGFEA